MEDREWDVVVIGAGIAGAAVAGNLMLQSDAMERPLRIVLVEAEDQPGYHTTGRSAAVFSEIYGNAPIRALTRASRTFFLEPPADFSDVPLMSPRGSLYVANASQLDLMRGFVALPDVAAGTRVLSPTEAVALTGCLREDYVAAALYEPGACDLDVHGLHHGYLRLLRKHGGKLVTGAAVSAIVRDGEHWNVATGQGSFRARTVVNAAGAWVDQVAKLAGAAPIGILPLRRTAFMVDAPADAASGDWPLTIDIEEQFYLKPDSGKLLLSPADETLTAPCDAWPEELDIAIAVDRIEQATTLEIKHVRTKWAGLRNFVQDRSPVVGFDPRVPGFFWVAALGGYGIQTAPAMGRLGAALLLRQPVPADLLEFGLELAAISPARITAPRLA